MVHTIKLTLLYCLIPLFFSCVGTEQDMLPRGEAPLTGMVYDTIGRPLRGVEVTVDTTLLCRTDINGRFITPPVAFGHYTITLSKSGFESQILVIDFFDPLEVLYVRLYSFEKLMRNAEASADDEDYPQARAYLRRAKGIYPDDPGLLMLLCAVFRQSGQYTEAARTAEGLKRLGFTAKTHPHIFSLKTE